MNIWIILAALLLVGLSEVALRLRSRAVGAEATLRSLAVAVGSEHVDAALLRDVRLLQSAVTDAEARADVSLGALEGASEGIAILDAEGGILYANTVAKILLDGAGERSVLKARIAVLAQRAARSGLREEIEVDVHEPERRVYAFTAEPLKSGERMLGPVVLYIDDLSVKRRVDAMRTDFVANASHELKTPLGALSLLAETLAVTTDEVKRTLLAERLVAESARMANVINDVAQLAETQSLGTEFRFLSVSDAVTDAVASIESYALEKGIRLEPGEMVDATVVGSRDQITSAIRNLLINAITYTAIKGADGVVMYRSWMQGKMVCVEVEDTGIGIPARYADRVFERFFRVDRARSRESGGTGLGLSIVKNVAIAHGGTVHMESEVGAGSRFSICLPISPEDAESPEGAE